MAGFDGSHDWQSSRSRSSSSGSSSSNSASDSFNNSRSRDNVADFQLPYLKQIYGNASNLFGQSQEAGQQFLQQQYPGLLDSASGAMGNLLSGAQGNPFSANISNKLQGRLGSFLEGQPDFAQADHTAQRAFTRSNDNFNENIMPAIRQNALSAGQIGSSRQGVAEGIAAKGLQQQQGDIASDIYGRAFDQANQNQRAGAQMASQLYSDNANRAAAGLDQTSKLVNLGLTPSQVGFNNLERYADIVGGPTVLSESDSRGRSKSRSSSQSQNSSKSKAKSWKFAGSFGMGMGGGG